MKKKLVLLLTMMAVLLAFAGCGKKEETAAPAEETEAAAETGESTEIANPWTEYASGEEAAKAAGIEPLEVPEMEIWLGKVVPTKWRSMESLVECEVEYAASMLTIRKGTGFEDGDCSGDYNSYAHAWTVDVNGTEVKCFGNDEGRSTKTIWTAGDYAYSINALGLGGDENFGIDEEAINILVGGLK